MHFLTKSLKNVRTVKGRQNPGFSCLSETMD